jgi:nucleoid-associated protein YgaU
MAIGITLIPQKPYPTLKGIQIMLREMGAKDPKAAAAKPEQFVDLTFIGELDKSGFVDRLYKSTSAIASTEEKPVAKPTGGEKTTLVSKPTLTSQAKATPVSVKAAQPSSATTFKIAKGEEHTIRAGDTLTKLAEQYYGSAGKWERIYEANRESIKNPNYVFIGQKITIPPAAGPGS